MNKLADISILIVDDHKIIRDGIRSLLFDYNHIKILAEASNGQEAIEKIQANPEIKVVLLDINMPVMDGLECAKKIRDLGLPVKILALTMLKEDRHIRTMVEHGALGYLLKDAGEDELVTAIQAVASGKPFFSDEATAALLRQIMVKQPQEEHHIIELTEREQDVLKLIANEFTNQEIAEKLFISVRTVDAHRRNLMEKIGAKNMAGLVKYAFEHGII